MKNRIKNIILLPLVILILTGCANRYVEPTDINNNANLIIHFDDLQADSSFFVTTTAYLDGQLIDRYKYPHMAVAVSSGKHKLVVEVTSIYKGRAKHNISREYEINFIPKQIYKVEVNMITEELNDIKENAEAKYRIISDDLLIEETLVLEDSLLRSPSKTNIQETVTNAVVQTVVLPAM